MLTFHHPDQLKDKLDLDIPDKPLTLDQLLEDCRDTLKYQVKTGNWCSPTEATRYLFTFLADYVLTRLGSPKAALLVTYIHEKSVVLYHFEDPQLKEQSAFEPTLSWSWAMSSTAATTTLLSYLSDICFDW